MCRNIRTLFNFEPPATPAEVQAAALQYVRKISGTRAPSQSNQAVFDRAVAEIAEATQALIDALQTKAPPRDRQRERQKALARQRERFG